MNSNASSSLGHRLSLLTITLRKGWRQNRSSQESVAGQLNLRECWVVRSSSESGRGQLEAPAVQNWMDSLAR